MLVRATWKHFTLQQSQKQNNQLNAHEERNILPLFYEENNVDKLRKSIL